MTQRVLVVEDEALIAIAVEAILEETGFPCELAVDGEQAMAALDRSGGRFSAVVAAIRLPQGPDGWEVARHARMLNPDLPVIYVSGDSAPHWEANGVPGSVMLSKPYAFSELTKTLTELVRQ